MIISVQINIIMKFVKRKNAVYAVYNYRLINKSNLQIKNGEFCSVVAV